MSRRRIVSGVPSHVTGYLLDGINLRPRTGKMPCTTQRFEGKVSEKAQVEAVEKAAAKRERKAKRGKHT